MPTSTFSPAPSAHSLGAAPTPTASPASLQSPAIAPGTQSSEFRLALIVLAAVFAALWAGRLDSAQATTLIGLVVSAYPSLRTWLKARHLDMLVEIAAEEGARAMAAGKTIPDGAAISVSDDLPHPAL